MILDKIENLDKYSFSDEFVKAIKSTTVFTKGKFALDQNNYYGIGLEYHTQEADMALWEAHRKYLDIHIIQEGEEMIAIADIANAKSTKEYEDDYELFSAIPEQQVHLKKGYFLVLFPNEVHRTTECVSQPVIVRKFVFKYQIDA